MCSSLRMRVRRFESSRLRVAGGHARGHGALRRSVRGMMLGCSSAGVGLGATGSSIAGELLDEAVLFPVEGITHCKDSPPAGGPNVEELPNPSCEGAAAAALLVAAALTFLPVADPTSAALISRHKGTAAGRQTTGQAVALWPQPRTWTWDRVGDDRRRALVSCSVAHHVPLWASKATSEKTELHSRFVCPKHMHPSRPEILLPIHPSM